MRYFLFLIFLLFHSTNLFSAITIQGKNQEYAGKKLDFYTFSDPVTKEKEFVFSLEFDKTGQCKNTLDINKTSFVFAEFGIYRGMLFLESNQTIELKFPPLRERTFADQKNPYFEAIPFWFATTNNNLLSSQISDFTIQLNQLTNKYFDRLYFRQSKEIYDSIVYLLDEKFPATQSDIFSFHKKFTLKSIQAEAFREKPEDYSSVFNDVKTEFWLFPSFIELFEKTFTNQLSFEAKSIKGENIRKAVNQSNVNDLLDFIKLKYKITGENAQLILLKLLHDAWYSGDFSKPAIQSLVNASIFANSRNKIIRQTSENITHKFTFLQSGSIAPAICLKDLTGKATCTNQTEDKFKYLIFADTEMIVCREHLKYLSKIQERFQKYLEIFVILRNTDNNEMKKFFADNKIPGTKLMDVNNEFIEKYDVKSFPQCFLLDENHKVKFVSAKAPLDGFEQQFGSFIQRELFERQRNQSR